MYFRNVIVLHYFLNVTVNAVSVFSTVKFLDYLHHFFDCIPATFHVVVAVITLPLPRDGGTARTAIQVHAVNLIEIRLGEDSNPFRTRRAAIVFIGHFLSFL